MKLRLTILLIALLLTPAYGKTKKRKCPPPKPTCGAKAIGDCPNEGCGGDPEMNKRKNIKTAASGAEKFLRSDFVKLKFPAKWKAGTKRGLLKDWGEGQPVEYEAFLMKVKNYPCGMESCNCMLTKDENNDFHLVTNAKPTDAEDDSITGEITPRFRADGWTLTKLKKLAKDKTYVKLTGYLFLDTQHLNSNVPARITDWEIHPVTSFKVCTGSVASCKAGNNWQDLSSFPEP